MRGLFDPFIGDNIDRDDLFFIGGSNNFIEGVVSLDILSLVLIGK
jgi:hypothetical protein